MSVTATKAHLKCWTCRQPATHTLTRRGSNTLHACDNCTRIDRAEAESRGWTVTPIARATSTGAAMAIDPKTVGEPVDETAVVTGVKKLTVSTVLLDPASSSYTTTVFDDSDDREHHEMRLGDDWVVGWGQQVGTRQAALDMHREAVHAARSEEPRPLG
jgi:hypothetical protein